MLNFLLTLARILKVPNREISMSVLFALVLAAISINIKPW